MKKSSKQLNYVSFSFISAKTFVRLFAAVALTRWKKIFCLFAVNHTDFSPLWFFCTEITPFSYYRRENMFQGGSTG